MDGVFTMQDYYARGGLVFSHRNLRFHTEVPLRMTSSRLHDDHIAPLAAVPFDRVLEYDRICFPASRPIFLKEWLAQDDALALGCARMYLGPPPALAHERVFGITTFELG